MKLLIVVVHVPALEQESLFNSIITTSNSNELTQTPTEDLHVSSATL